MTQERLKVGDIIVDYKMTRSYKGELVLAKVIIADRDDFVAEAVDPRFSHGYPHRFYYDKTFRRHDPWKKVQR